MTTSPDALTAEEFGPRRAIGLSMIARGGSGDFSSLWHDQFLPRADEIAHPDQAAAFGVCRCVPGAADGSFEYLALLEATADASIPAGMVAVDLPQSHYAVFEVPGLDAISTVWGQASQAIADQEVWKPYCGPAGCQCATHPGFELYPSDFQQTRRLVIYVPVYRDAS